MNWNIELSDGLARTVEGHRARLAGRQKKGPDTLQMIEILDAVLAEMPTLFDVGDDVALDGDPGWVIDSFTKQGARAVIHSVDHEDFQVVTTDRLTHIVPDSALINDEG